MATDTNICTVPAAQVQDAITYVRLLHKYSHRMEIWYMWDVRYGEKIKVLIFLITDTSMPPTN